MIAAHYRPGGGEGMIVTLIVFAVIVYLLVKIAEKNDR